MFGDLIDRAKRICDRIWHVKPLRDSIAHGVPDEYVPAMDAVQFKKINRFLNEERRQVPAISHRAGGRLVRFTMLTAACRDLYAIIIGLNDLLLSLRALAQTRVAPCADGAVGHGATLEEGGAGSLRY